MERFWSKVEKTDGCWIWTGSRLRRRDGTLSYGSFHYKGRQTPAHRVAWQLTHGFDPVGFYVCHHCDNTACVRPDHLYVGTHADNTRDAMERRRMSDGERIWNHKLTEADVPLIRALAATGLPTEQIGPRFGVSGRTVRYILTGKRWKHVA